MNQLPDRIVHLPIIWRGKRLFSARLRLAVHEAALPDVLAGEAAQALATLPVPAGADGLLLRCVVDPGWRTRSLRDDSVAFVLSRDVWHYLAWTGRYEDFLEGRYSAKTRESYARDEARLLERCGQALDLREYREPAQVDEFAGHLARLRGHGTPIGRPVEPVALKATAQRGTLRAFALFADGEPVAALALEAQGEVLHYLCSVEHDDFRQWSAGTVLHLQAIRRVFAEPGLRYLDFRPGECEVKRQFANGALRGATVLCLRRTLRHRLLLKLYGWLYATPRSPGAQPVVPAEVRELVG